MCVVFFYQNEKFESNGYRLVLVNNRDEKWTRPTKCAQFWGSGLHNISGLDMADGKEGGTWLGMNKYGKIGVILNVPGQGDQYKRGRGFLVSDFLLQNYEMEDYLNKISKEHDDYSGFNLILFDTARKEEVSRPMYLTNARNFNISSPTASLHLNKIHGFSNSPLEFPFYKALRGKQRIDAIVQKYSETCTKEYLVEELMKLMADKTPYPQDPVLDKVMLDGHLDPSFTINRSAINVCSPQEQYGTRTTTIILVDGEGTVDYIEKTVDYFSPDLTEETVHQTFELEEPTVTHRHTESCSGQQLMS